MAAGHPVELRERIVGAHQVQGLGVDEIAEVFQVGVASVRRYLRIAASGASLVPGVSTGRPPKIGERELAWLRSELESDPYVTSYELTARFNKAFRSKQVHRSTVLRAMHRLGFTHKKRRR